MSLDEMKGLNTGINQQTLGTKIPNACVLKLFRNMTFQSIINLKSNSIYLHCNLNHAKDIAPQ